MISGKSWGYLVMVCHGGVSHSLVAGRNGSTVAETVLVVGEDRFDADGNLIPGGSGREIPGCVVDTAGQSKIDDLDVSDGNTDTLRILAPGGTTIRQGERVQVRGVEYTVKHIPFDASVGRRPALARHKPKVLFIVERKES